MGLIGAKERSEMMKTRPRKFIMISIKSLSGAKCLINCFPQQIWEFIIDGNEVNLSRKNVNVYVPKADFEKYWIVKE